MKTWLARLAIIVGSAILVASCGGGGGGDDSGQVNPVAPPAAPTAPFNLSVGDPTSATLTLRWDDTSTNEAGFRIERSLSPASGFAEVGTVAADVETFTDRALSPSTTYFYRVFAFNATGDSPESNTVGMSTLAVPVVSPNPPSGLAATDATSASLRLAWTDNSDNESGFRIERSTSAASGFALIATVGADVTSHVDTGLVPSTTYHYRVLATNSAGDSAYSAVASGSTLAPPVAAPVAPASLIAGNATSSSLDLKWSDRSDNESGFRIERSTSPASGFAVIATVGANVSGYTNKGLAASTTHYFRVLATNGAGDSAYSNVASGSTLAAPAAVPAAPVSLATGNATSSSLGLTWADQSDNESGFKVERSTSAGTGFVQVATVGANATSYVSSGLSAATTYFFRVRAYNSAGDSAYTNTASGTTQAMPVLVPVAPSGLTTGGATTGSLRLSWTDASGNETGFRIEYSTSPTSRFTQVGSTGANVTSFVVTGLGAGTTYYFRVRAYNAAGDSAYSNTASGTTLAQSQTVTLHPLASNCVSTATLGDFANTVTPNCFPTVGLSDSGIVGDLHGWQAFASAVRFDLSALSGKTIESATLTLEVRSTGVGFYPRNFQIGAIASPWTASTLTWNLMASFAYYAQSWRAFAYPTYAGQIYSIDQRETVQRWASGIYADWGLTLQSVEYTPPGVVSLDVYEFYLPTLTVTYH